MQRRSFQHKDLTFSWLDAGTTLKFRAMFLVGQAFSVT
jgi:hypothetical protein